MNKGAAEEKRFQKNVEIWSQTNPKAAIYLASIDCSHLIPCTTQCGQPNLKIVSGKSNNYIHSNSDALEEAEQWFAGLDLHNMNVLCVYGVGLGYAYEAAKAWLKKDANRHLIFLEDDLAVIAHLLGTKGGTEILKNEQVQVLFFSRSDLEDDSSVVSNLYWSFLTTKMLVSALPYYEKAKNENFLELKHKILYEVTLKDGFLSEYLNFGASFYKNFYPNMLSLPGAYLGNNLFGKFQNVPAIICGAGPSLEKNVSQLNALRERALIFAGGSALNVLNEAGIQPHFGAGVDPNIHQCDRISRNSAFEVPFLYRNRLYHDALSLIHGPRLYVTGSGGYDTSEWFEKKLKIKGTFIEEGYNVVNFCLELAHAFGCNPIIFVGLDLAYTGMRTYAPGITPQTKISEHDILNPYYRTDAALMKKDIFGQPIYTMWKWVAESQWVGAFVKDNPKIKVINATEGGLGCPNVPNQPLEEVVKTHLCRLYDLDSWVHSEIQNSAMPQVTLSKIVKAMKEFQKSLIKCKESLEILLEETHKMTSQIEREKRPPLSLQSGRAALCETELSEEPGYRHVLEIFNLAYTRLLSREISKLREGNGMPEWRLLLERLSVNARKLHFLREVSAVNIDLIQDALKTSVSKKL